MFGVDIVLDVLKVVLKWIDDNKKVAEKVQGLLTYMRAIQTALLSFKPKGTPSKALQDILTVTYQCVRDIKELLDQVNQGQKKWLFSPDSYYKKLEGKERELSTIIPVLSLAFNVDQYHKSEDIIKALEAAPAGGAAKGKSSPANVPVMPPQAQNYFPVQLVPVYEFVPYSQLPVVAPAPAAGAQVAGGAVKPAAPAPAAAAAPSNQSQSLRVTPRPLADALLTGDGHAFWKKHFTNALTVTTDALLAKVEADFGGPFDAATKAALTMAVDHNKDGIITIYEFAKFASPTLAAAVGQVKVVPPKAKADEKKEVCHVLWCDPNDKLPNSRIVAAAAEKKVVVVQVPSAKDGIEYLKARPDLMYAENFRVMSSNAIYMDVERKLTSQEVLDAKMSAAEDIIRYLRQRRSLAPVLIYCGWTLPQAEKIAKLYDVTKATNNEAEAKKFAMLEPFPWITDASK